MSMRAYYVKAAILAGRRLFLPAVFALIPILASEPTTRANA
jgi:hypothetical protein